MDDVGRELIKKITLLPDTKSAKDTCKQFF